MNENVKKYLVITLQTIFVTICAIIIRHIFYQLILYYDLPEALIPLIYWLLLFLASWAPRPAIYIPLTVSVSISLFMILSFTENPKNPVTGTLLNYILIIIFTETFKKSINKLKLSNKKLQQEKEKAKNATKQKDIFLAKMSHELRTPLNGIKGITELLLDKEECKENVNYLEMTKEAADTLQFLIDDLLDISKIENNLVSLEAKSFMLHQFLKRLCSLFEEPATVKQLNYRYTISQNLPECVIMDNQLLKQILSNLISNAIKYTDTGGTVKVHILSSRNDENKTILTMKISDTGKGIPENEKDLIFNSFYRALDTYNTKASGIGLGLYIVKRYVELFGGTIQVESTPGKGSSFVVDIPLQVDREKSCLETGLTPLPEQKSRNDREKLEILVAEDNRINAFFIGSLIEKYGHNLSLVENGVDAINHFKENEYDLILMDIQMPGMSGIEAITEITAIESEKGRKHTYTAALTAYATETDKKEIEQHFDYFITKPIDSTKFLNMLHSLSSLKK